MPPSLQVVQVTLQALSAFAIAGGLLYTAVQFREARKAQGVANFAKLVEMQYGLRRLRVENPALASVHANDVQHLHTDRDIQEYFLNLMQLSLFEIAWYSHRQGQLPADYFRSWDARMRDIAAEPSFRTMMAVPSMKIMHDEFQRYITDMVRATPARAHKAAPDAGRTPA